ncbi:MAG: hypothetical protein LAN62_17855 [Acidobacteriia bacterium]|nr:hypothetical protein [Terriglobia bacterium]
MSVSDHVWTRYLPGLVAATGGAALIGFAPRRHKIAFAVLATLLGLTCMEAEYWLAHGFPQDEVPFFIATAFMTSTALFLGKRGGFALGMMGLAFFAYVNTRYGAPYLLDYILPVFYAVLVALSRREMDWSGSTMLRPGWPEASWIVIVHAITLWRTTELGKWGWILGRPW